MPGRITHIEALRQAVVLLENGNEREERLARLIRKPFSYAALGAMAPDIFFFYGLTKEKRQLGSLWLDRAHHDRVFETIIGMADYVRNVPAGLIRARLMAFLMGYIAHCAADAVIHPYIFYRSGDYYNADPAIAGIARKNHVRVEYALDSYLIKQRWGLTPLEYHFARYVTLEDGVLDFDVRFMWLHALRQAFGKEFYETYAGSMDDAGKEDLLSRSYKNFISFHRSIDVRNFSCRFVLRTIDALSGGKTVASIPLTDTLNPFDIANEKKKEWCYPADPEKKSEESFMEILNRASRTIRDVVNETDRYLEGRRKRSDLERMYAGINLDTGLRKVAAESMVAFTQIGG